VCDALLQVSTVLGAALEEQRKEGEYMEGIAIWVAVAIVIMVGECLGSCLQLLLVRSAVAAIEWQG
jgi:hypothetical protein